MPSPTASAPVTWDDFVALDDEDRRELIDGELVEVEVPRSQHEEIVVTFGSYLRAWVEAGRAIATSLADDETFRPESFEGLEIPLAKLWA